MRCRRQVRAVEEVGAAAGTCGGGRRMEQMRAVEEAGWRRRPETSRALVGRSWGGTRRGGVRAARLR